jgi:uncharacterized protein (DUF302 family)
MPSERSATEAAPDRRSEVGDWAVVTKLSPWSMADTLARLFAVIDHGGKARDVGLHLRDTKLVVFGSPSATTRVIDAAPLAALDLPLRVVVWKNGHQTLVSYPAPAAVARRYGLEGSLADAISNIDALISAVINR